MVQTPFPYLNQEKSSEPPKIDLKFDLFLPQEVNS